MKHSLSLNNSLALQGAEGSLCIGRVVASAEAHLTGNTELVKKPTNQSRERTGAQASNHESLDA